MKIEGPNRTSATSSSKGKGKVSSGDGSFSDLLTGGVKETRSAVKAAIRKRYLDEVTKK